MLSPVVAARTEVDALETIILGGGSGVATVEVQLVVGPRNKSRIIFLPHSTALGRVVLTLDGGTFTATIPYIAQCATVKSGFTQFLIHEVVYEAQPQ